MASSNTQVDVTKLTDAQLDQEIAATKAKLVQQGQVSSAPVWWSNTNAMTMCSAILVFGLVVCGLCTYLLRKGTSAEQILRTFGVVLIIVAALFLVVAGYEDKQIASAITLFGTIIGYVIGKGNQSSEEKKDSTNPPNTGEAESLPGK